MKFSVSSTDLLKQLQIVGGAIPSNPVLPILEDFLFTISGNTLEIAATDLDISIMTTIDVNAEGEGMIAIPGKILMDTLKELPQQPVTIQIDEEGGMQVKITSSHGKYSLVGENGQDFPEIPTPETVDKVSMESATLSKAINKTLFATSNDDLRPAMTGVYLDINFSKVIFVATDAHKLVRYTFNEVNGQVTSSFILPKKAVSLLKNTLPSTGAVSMEFNESHAFFTFDKVHMACRLVDARYPDYNAVIPTENPNHLSLSRKDFLNSLKRIAIYANKTTNQVILNIQEGSLTLSAQDLDFSNEATEQLSCTYTGEPLSIAFNAKFLIEMLNVLDSDDVQLEMSSPTRAGILLPTEKEDNEEILMLVMPVMLSN